MQKTTTEVLPLSNDRLESLIPEFKTALDSDAALAESTRCFYCYDAPCVKACPTSIEIPEFIRKISTGNIQGAAHTILSANILGHSCARVCPVEVLCQKDCVYQQSNQPVIQIGRLQRYATDYIHQNGIQLFKKGASTGKKVAVIGAGPAGLACAHELSIFGHDVTIFEAKSYAGGLNTSGVAPYKMHSDISLEEVDYITSIGISLKYGITIGKDISGDELEASFDAIFVGVGLGKDSFSNISGRNLEGVVGAVELIETIKTTNKFNPSAVSNAVVIGGGNTAIDVVRELCYLGIPNVSIIYRRTKEEMSGYEHEWLLAAGQGVKPFWQTLPTEIIGSSNKVTSLKCTKVDVDKNRKITEIDGSSFELLSELVVFATGQERLNTLFKELQINFNDGKIEVNPETFQTNRKKFFAGGDCINGGKEVVNAAHDGKAAAQQIHKILLG